MVPIWLPQPPWRQPCQAFVYWNAFVADDPDCVPDGQHPDPTGQAWLRSTIGAWVGRVQALPSAPTALTAAVPPTMGVGSGQVRLAWNAPEGTEAKVDVQEKWLFGTKKYQAKCVRRG